MRAVSLLLLLCIGCSTADRPCQSPVLTLQQVPALGERLRRLPTSCSLIVAASAQMWTAYEATVNGIQFTIGVDDDDGVVHFVSTRDPAFETPEGLRVGVPPPAGEIIQERGWGHYVRHPSGWHAYIAEANEISNLNLGTRPLGPEARVTMFFLRDH